MPNYEEQDPLILPEGIKSANMLAPQPGSVAPKVGGVVTSTEISVENPVDTDKTNTDSAEAGEKTPAPEEAHIERVDKPFPPSWTLPRAIEENKLGSQARPVIETQPKRSKTPLIVAGSAVVALAAAGGAYVALKSGGESTGSATPVTPDKNTVTTANIPPSGDTIANGSVQVTASAEQGTSTADAQTSAVASAPAEATGSAVAAEAVVNPDGTVSFPVEAFKNNPEALGKAFMLQGTTAWLSAGGTLANLDNIFTTNGKTIPVESHAIAQANKNVFADALLEKDWRSKPELVAFADQMASNNERDIMGYFITTNSVNAPNPDPNHVIPEGFDQRGLESYKRTRTVTNVTSVSTSPTQVVVEVNWEDTDNFDKTALPAQKAVSKPTYDVATSKLVFVAEGDDYKLAQITSK